MILLTTPSVRAGECAAAIESGTGEKAQVADSLQQAVGLLREQEYGVIVLDQCMLDVDPDQAEVVLRHTGTSIVLNVNCAITGAERIVREVRAALLRRDKELRAARTAAEQVLRSDLREPLTALLLECELAMSLPNLPLAAKDKLRNVHELARTIRDRIGMEHSELMEA
jgi:signal transduction histidine kinase